MRTFTNPSGTAGQKAFKFEDLPTPTLSHERKEKGEGTISLEVCMARKNKHLHENLRELV